MGMDGLSMANTGALKESTSADFSSRTEQIVQNDKANDSKQVQTLDTNRRIKEKDEEEQQKKQKRQESSASEEFEDGLFEQENVEEEFDIEDLENPNRDFFVKLNAKDDIIV